MDLSNVKIIIISNHNNSPNYRNHKGSHLTLVNGVTQQILILINSHYSSFHDGKWLVIIIQSNVKIYNGCNKCGAYLILMIDNKPT